MFSSVVVPLDLEPHGDRALPIAGKLAAAAGPPPRLAELGERGRAEDTLTELADQVDNAVIVVASTRWTDPDRLHLRSVARRLAHDAHHPVLVVPAERVPTGAR